MIAICNYKANVKTLSNKKKKTLNPLFQVACIAG